MAHIGTADAKTLRQACAGLIADYDTVGWWPAASPFEVMVGAVLVQNTRWTNVARAIAALQGADRLSPQALASTASMQLTQLISSAGCQRVKARRLLSMANGVLGAGGMRSLARQPVAELRAELLRWHGIGEETADAILLFAFDRPGFLGDAYARRWLARRGLFDAGQGGGAYGRAKAYVDARLDWSACEHQALHAAIVLHAQQLCRSTPLCNRCRQAPICSYKTNN